MDKEKIQADVVDILNSLEGESDGYYIMATRPEKKGTEDGRLTVVQARGQMSPEIAMANVLKHSLDACGKERTLFALSEAMATVFPDYQAMRLAMGIGVGKSSGIKADPRTGLQDPDEPPSRPEVLQ